MKEKATDEIKAITYDSLYHKMSACSNPHAHEVVTWSIYKV